MAVMIGAGSIELYPIDEFYTSLELQFYLPLHLQPHFVNHDLGLYLLKSTGVCENY